MPSYRFCRPDDIPLLVRAVERCVRADDPDEPEWTEESFRRGMREIDLWPSNSMVALDSAGEPVAVTIGTKRPEEVAVHRLGVRADHRRQGHGLHLLTSLSQKLAVLGPERLVAEVPEDRPAALACFAAAGWRREATLVDWRRPAEAAEADEPVPAGLVEELPVAELDAAGVLADAPTTAWCRTRRTLAQSADRLAAAAIVSPERLEAWAVFESRAAAVALHAAAAPEDRRGGDASACGGDGASVPSEPPGDDGSSPTLLSRREVPVRLLAFGCADPDHRPLLFGVLVRWLSSGAANRPLLLPRLTADELPPDLLAAHGFVPGRAWARLAATARPL
ncbi:MAG TPA: GNAT family N-acetyltransferase [Thermoanaerobaculia bacterium]|nr:GNAT family N-acetyltransferase [Thermoanaerobaculia bacterium]